MDASASIDGFFPLQVNMARHEEEERRVLVVSGQLAEARAERDAQKVASLEAVLARLESA
jgi:hypothetical protein